MKKNDKSESIREFYERKFEWIPENLRNDIGHFNVFRLEPFAGKSVPYKRRDYYKVTLVNGNSHIHFADQVVEVKKQALSFSNPHIPYKWEHLDSIRSGAFAVFTPAFFHNYGDLSQYEVFQPNGTHIFELTDDQASKVNAIFEKMFEEIGSDYVHKYDVLRNLVFELLHFATKMKPTAASDAKSSNANQRISLLFMELLERQFPIDDSHREMKFRTASDFAGQLNVHVNHLNRALKDITKKTTTQIIAERVVQEAKVLLSQSSWNVSEVAYALGFSEVTHFDNFFKKHAGVTPSTFRNSRSKPAAKRV